MKYYVYYTFKKDEPIKGYIGMTTKPISSCYKGSGIFIVRAFRKYSKKNFIRINVGEYEDKDECYYWEGFYIKYYKTLVSQGGYNISPKGGSPPLSINSKLKMSLSRTGKHHTEETKLKMSLAQKNMPRSKESIEKMRKTKLDKKMKMSDEQKHKISLALKHRISPMKGKKHSIESRKKMSLNHKSVKGQISLN